MLRGGDARGRSRRGSGWLLPILSAGIVLACGPPQPGNILILVVDDLGVDMLGAYREGADLPRTPNIDDLAARGVLFRNAWSSPLCSPARAAIQTGRYGFRTGIGTLVKARGYALPLEELTLPEMLDLGTGGRYAHAAIGKWHLGNKTVGGADAPNLAGYSHFAGIPRSIDDYFAFEDVVDGTARQVRRYATSQQVDDARDWIRSAPAPWLCYLAFIAVHKPYHAPPEELHSIDLPGPYRPKREGPQRPFYKAMLEALDTEIGRLLRSIDPRVLDDTTVIFVGDNGSHWDVTLPPFDSERSKSSLYEGGINVPLIIAGPIVEKPGREVAAVVDVTDIFATVAGLAGVDLDAVAPMAAGPLDSVSLLPYLRDPKAASVRATVYAEIFSPNGVGPNENVKRAIRNERYKLIRTGWVRAGDEFYDLLSDPFERRNLLLRLRTSEEALAVYEEFSAALDRQAALGASPVTPGR